MTKKPDANEETISHLDSNIAKAKDLLGQLVALFPDAYVIASDDRRQFGRMGIDESEVLLSVIDAVDARPETFACLADEDEGHDPHKVETSLVRDRFHRHQGYAQLASLLEDAAAKFSDAALTYGTLVKPFALAAYEIAKPLSKRDPVIREKIAKALDFYGARGRASAAARHANKAQPK